MKYILFTILVSVTSAFSAGNTTQTHNETVILNEANFEGFLKDKELVFVMFYVPWCRYSQEMLPELDKAAATLKTHVPKIYFAKIDCEGNGAKICTQYNIQGYPTLEIFRKGRKFPIMQDPRTADEIVEYAKSHVGRAAKILNTTQALDDYLVHANGSIVGYFAQNHTVLPSFLLVSEVLRDDFKFAAATSPLTLTAKNITSGSIILYPVKTHEDPNPKPKKYNGPADPKQLMVWIYDNYDGRNNTGAPIDEHIFNHPH